MAAARYLVVVAGAESGGTDALADALRDAFAVRTAYSGADLAATLDAEVDAVLVDPETPGVSASSLRALCRERDLQCLVGLLTDERSVVASDPPAADSPVDDPRVVDEYLPRPAPGDPGADWLETVESLAVRARYRKRLEEYYDLAEEYAAVQARLRERERDPDGGVSSMGEDGVATAGTDDDRAGEGPGDTDTADADPDSDRTAADLVTERARLGDLLARIQADLADLSSALADESVFETALDRPGGGAGDWDEDPAGDGDEGPAGDGDDTEDGPADGDSDGS